MDSTVSGRQSVTRTQYRARWRPSGGKSESTGIFAHMKRKLLLDNVEAWKWLLEDVEISNVAEKDREGLRGMTVAPRGRHPGTEEVEK